MKAFIIFLVPAIILAQDVPGIEEWRQHQRQVLEAEKRLGLEGVDVTSVTVPTNAKGVPGIEKWQQHQAAALKAEKLLDQEDSTQLPTTTLKTTSKASKKIDGDKADALRSILQSAIKRFVSRAKTSENDKNEAKKESKKKSDDKYASIIALLQGQGDRLKPSKKLKNLRKNKPSNSNSFLDNLIESYKSESNDEIFEELEFRRPTFIAERPRFRDIYSSLERFDYPFSSSRSFSRYSPKNDIDEALFESRIIDRELHDLLRRIEK